MKIALRYLLSEYKRWLMQSKNITLLIGIVLVRKVVIVPLLDAAKSMNTPLQIWETSIAVGNSGLVLLLLPVFFIVLISDFPFLDSNLYFVLPRIGRKRWCVAQILFVYVSALSYVVFIIFTTFIQTAFESYVFDGWSLVVTDYEDQFRIRTLIPLNLYNQMSPVKAFLWTFLLLFLFTSLSASVILLGSSYGKKKLAVGAWIITIMLGMATTSLKITVQWIFPSSHAILWIHYDCYFRAVRFPVACSALILLFLSILFNILSYRKMKRIDYSSLGEGEMI